MSDDTEKLDIGVIGGGVIGCAIAARLAKNERSVAVFEKHGRLGSETTERNSGVLHAGLYYKSGSLKERLCIRGNELLQDYAKKQDVPLQMIGKFIVATNIREDEQLELFWSKISGLGIPGLSRVTSSQLRSRESLLQGTQAIFSANTGIIDQPRLVESLAREAESHGALILTHCEVSGVHSIRDGYRVETSRGPVDVGCVINSAGLHATHVSELAGIDAPKTFTCRGDYFKLRGKAPFKSLVYPVKDPLNPGLGIHFTLDTGGGTRLGPDAEYVTEISYEPREEKLQKFLQSGRKFLPDLKEEDLTWEYCGIRPKLRSADETEEKDFYIRRVNNHWINLLGIESPGITSSLAIAECVEGLL